MSHFNCLVIHKEEQNIDELMAPYSEELKIKPYIRETKDKCYKKYLQAWNYYTVGGSWENLLPRKKGAKCNSCLITEVDWKKSIIIYSVVTPDGKWHSKGKMGWFGIGNETKEQAQNWNLDFYDHIIKPYLSNEFSVTILDCHI